MKTTIIPTLKAEHLVDLMKFPKNYKVMFPLGNKEGQRYFPDNEVYVRLPDTINEIEGRVVVIHSGQSDPNRGLVELQMILSVLRKTKARIEVFFSYFPYSMQDHAFNPGETNAAEDLVSKLCVYYKVKRIYTLDAHFCGKGWVEKYPITNISAVELLKKKALKKYPKAIFMAPDAGSQRRVGLCGTEKKRTNSFDVTIECDESFKKTIKGKIVGVVDDLVETGGTLSKFVDLCKSNGAKDVIALITHGVLISGIKRIETAYKDVYITNSIKREDANVDISSLILQTITAKK